MWRYGQCERIIFDDVLGPSSKHFKWNTGNENFVSEKLAIVLDIIVKLVTGSLCASFNCFSAEALGKNVNKSIVNGTSIRRAM